MTRDPSMTCARPVWFALRGHSWLRTTSARLHCSPRSVSSSGRLSLSHPLRDTGDVRLLDRFRDREVVLTHMPGDWCKPGTLYRWREGEPLYRITRVVPTYRTSLLNGGSAPCWQVRGVLVD